MWKVTLDGDQVVIRIGHIMAKRSSQARVVRAPGGPLPASEFKARCLELMDYVRASGRDIVITKHGKPVAKLVPIPEPRVDPFGALKGTVTYHGDIVAPTGERWSAEED
jgi:prevent-host-death family protein